MIMSKIETVDLIFAEIVLRCTCVTPDILFYITGLAIMPVCHFGFYFCEICHGLSLCETLHFFYIHGLAFAC